jgi:hypothetical protein
VDHVRGDSTGLLIPAHPGALRTAGAEFLTTAFHAYGSLSRTNSVVCIERFEPYLAGSTGQKISLVARYAHPEEDLPNELFVKFSRDFNNAFRDRRRSELEAEIKLCELSRLPAFPIRVPTPFFADFDQKSGTGLLITQRIPFGAQGVESLRHKCMDHELSEPLAYYRAILSALARLAAAHKSGLLSPQVEELFPFDLEAAVVADPIPWTESELGEHVARYAAFARSCPQLLPAHLAKPAFIARLERDAQYVRVHERAIKRYLHADPDYVALSHFNSNIDNAWFWRGTGGALQCGLFDWQRARQMNLGYALWGGLCGAGLEIWEKHRQELVRQFAVEVHALGGPQLDVVKLGLHLDLYAATMGLAGLIETPALVLANLPEAARASGPLDPIFRKSEVARSFLHIFTNFLSVWYRNDFVEIGVKHDAWQADVSGQS